MVATAAQMAANRRNAQRSTGPKTEAGRAASSRNALKHGGAAAVDAPTSAAEAARVEARAAALARELGAVGAAGAVLARRAAVLSLRMEAAAQRELVVIARDRAEALAAFDAERAEAVIPLVALLQGPDATTDRTRIAAALRDLATLPEGIAPLVALWADLARRLADADPVVAHAARARAESWLGLAPAATQGWSTPKWAERVASEVDRLRERDAALAPAREAVARWREEAGELATFDPSPEACLARRYEASAQNGFFRALKAIRDLVPTTAPVAPLAPAPPPPPPPPVAAQPPQPPQSVILPTPTPGLGSFRPGGLALPAPPPTGAATDLSSRLDHRRRRPDPRQLVRAAR